MSTEQTWQIESTSVENTLRIAEAVGRKLRGGEVIELTSDLGGGKTTFVKGLANGMGSTEVVHSPSFTLRNDYRAGKKTIYHFDFYRLQEPGIMRDELKELLNDTRAIIVIEWADIVEDVLPKERIAIHITATGDQSRRFEFSASDSLAYALPAKP